LRLLRSSRFALTLPDRFATGVFPRGAFETGRSCAQMAKVVFISCHGCFLFNEAYPLFIPVQSAGGPGYSVNSNTYSLDKTSDEEKH
jgi:hypothetical protein